jgi:hypothetical protein
VALIPVDDALTDQITSVAKILNLEEYVIEKDYYLTQVIGILSRIDDENF